VVDEESLKRYMIRERIRYKGYIPREMALQLRNRFGIKAILTGAIVSYSRDENPRFGIVARLVDASSGQVIWTDYASATGDDFTTFLGLGTISELDDLVPTVLQELFVSFSMEAPHKKEEALTIAVMPFKNDSRIKKAGRIASYMFMAELFKTSGFRIVEFGNVRKSLVEMRIIERGELNYDNIDALTEALETDWLLIGTVNRYKDGTVNNESPQAEITARLLDVISKRILWYDSSRLKGNDDVMIPEFGEIYSVDQVAYEVITELRERMESILW
jgi:TolB-like protein